MGGGKISIFIIAFIVDAVIAMVSMDLNSEVFSVCAWSLPTIVLLYSVITGEVHSNFLKNFFTNKIIKFVGNISFEFFMIHALVIRYLTKIAGVLNVTDMLLVFLLAFFVSITIAFFLHTILRKLQKKVLTR